DEMLPYFVESVGNAASKSHEFGWAADEAVERARAHAAELRGSRPTDGRAKQIVCTAGATESDSLALKGVAECYRDRGNHLVTVVTEHKAVLDSCKHLEKSGYRVTYLPVQKDGRIDLNQLAFAVEDRTVLVTIMAANN